MQRWPVTVLCTPMEEVRESWRDDERPTSPEWAIGNVQNKKMERRNFRIKKNKNKNKRRWPLNRPNSNQRRQDSVIYSRPVRSLRYFSQDDAAAARAKCKKKKKNTRPATNPTKPTTNSFTAAINRFRRLTGPWATSSPLSSGMNGPGQRSCGLRTR